MTFVLSGLGILAIYGGFLGSRLMRMQREMGRVEDRLRILERAYLRMRLQGLTGNDALD